MAGKQGTVRADPRKGKSPIIFTAAPGGGEDATVLDGADTIDLGGYAVSIVRFDPAYPLDQVLANPFNYRVHPPQQRHVVDGSLRTFGWVAAMMINEVTGHLIDGHERLDCALAAGQTTGPVNFVRLSPEREKALLAVYDPMTAMALHDHTVHMQLLRDSSDVPDAALQNYMLALLEQNAAQQGDAGPGLSGMVGHDPDDTGRTATDKLASYESATIRQLVLHYGPQDYGAMLDHLAWARDHWGVETNAEALRETLRQYRAEHEGERGTPAGGDTEDYAVDEGSFNPDDDDE